MATTDGTGTIYIDYEEWFEFIRKLAPFLRSTQFAVGLPKDNGDCIEIPYAYGDEVHPKEWAEPPAWLKGDR